MSDDDGRQKDGSEPERGSRALEVVCQEFARSTTA